MVFKRQTLRLLTPAVLELPAQDRGVGFLSHVRQRNLHHQCSFFFFFSTVAYVGLWLTKKLDPLWVLGAEVEEVRSWIPFDP